MKKIFVFIFSLLLTYGAYAQVKFNPKAGVNFSRVTSDIEHIDPDGAKVGFNLGLDLRFGEKWLFFQPGIHYSNVGGRLIITENNTSVKDQINVRSLKIPLDAGFYLSGTDGILKVRINAGLTPNIIFGVGNSNFNTEYTNFNTFGLGANAGLGFDLIILTLDFNYELGLTRVYESGRGKNNVFSISLGLVIPPTFR